MAQSPPNFDELQEAWATLDAELNRTLGPTTEQLRHILQQRSQSRLRRMQYLEGFGAIISACVVIYLLWQWPQYDNNLLRIAAVVAIVVFGASTAMGLSLVRHASRINIIEHTYQETIERFDAFKAAMRTYKWFSIAAYILLPFPLIIIVPKLILQQDILSQDPNKWLWSVGASLILLPFAWWFFYRFYRHQISQIKRGIPPQS